MSTNKPSIGQCLIQGMRALSAAYGGGPSVAFFPGMKCLFPSRNFHHFDRPKTNFIGFKKII